MTIQTYAIELKLDAPDEAHEALCAVIKQYARDLQATAMLLTGKGYPAVIAKSTDSFYTTQEIELLDPSDHVGAEVCNRCGMLAGHCIVGCAGPAIL